MWDAFVEKMEALEGHALGWFSGGNIPTETGKNSRWH